MCELCQFREANAKRDIWLAPVILGTLAAVLAAVVFIDSSRATVSIERADAKQSHAEKVASANLKYAHDHNCRFERNYAKPEPTEFVVNGEKVLIGGDIPGFDIYDCGENLKVFVDCYRDACKH